MLMQIAACPMSLQWQYSPLNTSLAKKRRTRRKALAQAAAEHASSDTTEDEEEPVTPASPSPSPLLVQAVLLPNALRALAPNACAVTTAHETEALVASDAASNAQEALPSGLEPVTPAETDATAVAQEDQAPATAPAPTDLAPAAAEAPLSHELTSLLPADSATADPQLASSARAVDSEGRPDALGTIHPVNSPRQQAAQEDEHHQGLTTAGGLADSTAAADAAKTSSVTLPGSQNPAADALHGPVQHEQERQAQRLATENPGAEDLRQSSPMASPNDAQLSAQQVIAGHKPYKQSLSPPETAIAVPNPFRVRSSMLSVSPSAASTLQQEASPR